VRPSRERLLALSASSGFRTTVLEKAARLLNLLNALRSHPFLKDRLALKGGTALNLFLLDLPRLSVDVDLNYIGSADKETMLSDRPQIEKAIEAVFGREDLSIQRKPLEHAGGKWLLQYQSPFGGRENLELDLNYMFRIPLWPITLLNSRKLGAYHAEKVPTVDIYELIAGKLAALFSRRASRDLFDVHQLLTQQTWDIDRLRLGFVLFGAMNRKDWRSVSLEDIGFDPQELEQTLLPVLRAKTLEGIEDTELWSSQMVKECREALKVVVPFSDSEREFLNCLLDRGEIKPELLTSDAEIQERIHRHPLLEWKALNVRKYQNQ
jgi:predicted nucleotidyltransferase component of viral defense system